MLVQKLNNRLSTFLYFLPTLPFHLTTSLLLLPPVVLPPWSRSSVFVEPSPTTVSLPGSNSLQSPQATPTSTHTHSITPRQLLARKNLSLNDNWFKKEQDQCNLCEFLIYLIYMTGDTGDTRERQWTYWARKISQKGPQFYSSENKWQPLPHLIFLNHT